MSSTTINVIFFCLVAIVAANALDLGKFQPLTPTTEEKEMCQNNANGKTLCKAYKKIWRTCYVQCKYVGDSKVQELMTPNGTLCCDFVGVGPTGTCNNGKCVPFWRQLSKDA